jgi:hypothetical protein
LTHDQLGAVEGRQRTRIGPFNDREDDRVGERDAEGDEDRGDVQGQDDLVEGDGRGVITRSTIMTRAGGSPDVRALGTERSPSR